MTNNIKDTLNGNYNKYMVDYNKYLETFDQIPLSVIYGNRCPEDQEWSMEDFKCILCPFGTRLTNKGQTVNSNGCKCPENSWWSIDKQTCYRCPDGTSINNTGEKIGIYECRCPDGHEWDGNNCILCPTGLSIHNTGGGYGSNCKCPGDSWFDNIAKEKSMKFNCYKCPSNSRFDYTGDIVGHDGCKCSDGTKWNGAICACPDGTTSNYESDPLYKYGGEVKNTGCSCPNDHWWSSLDNKCIKCPTDSGIHIATGNRIYMSGDTTNVPNCKCNNSENTSWNSLTNKCETCPPGSKRSNKTGNPTNIIGCLCDPGLTWNGRCSECPINAIKTSEGVKTNIEGCRCLPDMGWNGIDSCVPCLENTSTKYNGDPTVIFGCNCLYGQLWNGSTCN